MVLVVFHHSEKFLKSEIMNKVKLYYSYELFSEFDAVSSGSLKFNDYLLETYGLLYVCYGDYSVVNEGKFSILLLKHPKSIQKLIYEMF
jgi:hypothetical protein